VAEPPTLTVRVAEGYARAGLANIGREYPNQPAHLLTGPEDLLPPSALHPIFFGSYDWHSSVHQHWMLVRLLRIHPDLEVAATVRAALDERVTDEAARVEARYLEDPNRRSFERPYGWALAADAGRGTHRLGRRRRRTVAGRTASPDHHGARAVPDLAA